MNKPGIYNPYPVLWPQCEPKAGLTLSAKNHVLHTEEAMEAAPALVR